MKCQKCEEIIIDEPMIKILRPERHHATDEMWCFSCVFKEMVLRNRGFLSVLINFVQRGRV